MRRAAELLDEDAELRYRSYTMHGQWRLDTPDGAEAYRDYLERIQTAAELRNAALPMAAMEAL